jgi:hypothetical protein
MSEPTSKPRTIITKILGIGLICLVIFVCLFVVQFPIIMGLAQVRAKSLAPPQYPNSELIESEQGGGTDIMWERQVFQTPDSVEQVLVFMEEYIPGFQNEVESQRGLIYFNNVDDTGWIGKQAAEIACSSLFCIEREAYSYPGVSVTIYSNPDNPAQTLIQVWVSWPA